MKVKHIITAIAEIFVVEVPVGSRNISINNARGMFKYTDKINIVRWESLPFGNWGIIGKMNDLTEDQAAEIVEYSGKHKMFKDYKSNKKHKVNVYSLNWAINSFDRLLEVNGIIFKNPNYDPELTTESGAGIESKLWDIDRMYIFKKLKY